MIVVTTYLFSMFIPTEANTHGTFTITPQKVYQFLQPFLVILSVTQRPIEIIATGSLRHTFSSSRMRLIAAAIHIFKQILHIYGIQATFQLQKQFPGLC